MSFVDDSPPNALAIRSHISGVQSAIPSRAGLASSGAAINSASSRYTTVLLDAYRFAARSNSSWKFKGTRAVKILSRLPSLIPHTA